MTDSHDPLRDLIHQSLVSDKLTPSVELRTELEQRLASPESSDEVVVSEVVVSPAKREPEKKPRRRIVRAWHMALVVTAVLAVMVYLSLPERWQRTVAVNGWTSYSASHSRDEWQKAKSFDNPLSAQSKPLSDYGANPFNLSESETAELKASADPYRADDLIASTGNQGQRISEGLEAPQIELDPAIGEPTANAGTELQNIGTKPSVGLGLSGRGAAAKAEFNIENGGGSKGPGANASQFSSRTVGGVDGTTVQLPESEKQLQDQYAQGERGKQGQRDGYIALGESTSKPADPEYKAAMAEVAAKQRGELAVEQAARRRALATLTTRLSAVAADGEKTQELAKLTKKVKELGDQIATNEARADYIRRWEQGPGSEQYDAIHDNPFLPAKDAPLSTFSIDVDTASYANVRRFLTQGQVPPADAVRIEELLNYFSYDYPAPKGDEPFSVNMETAPCPWQADHLLLRVGLKGKEVHKAERPASNLVFLIDTSGSMSDEDKLPLVKQAMSMLTRELGERDRITIVTYAGEAGLKLAPTNGGDHGTITSVINSLNSNGSTHGSAGIQLAYQKARESFIKEGTNRVILCTDGDLNVGITQDDQLVDLITNEAKTGVFLTVLGFGQGNLKDSKMEKLADHGNGVYAYIDGVREAKKVLVDQLSGSLTTIAKDVKIQIEFNPGQVRAYRLIGYENRILAAKDFNDDTKDAGEIGAGHTVTALYELVPAGAAEPKPVVEDLKYQKSEVRGQGSEVEEIAEGDAPNDDKPQVRVYAITTEDPKDVLKVLQNRFAGQPHVRMAVDPKTGSLIAHAIPSEHATIKALINETVKGDVQKELLTLKLRFKQPDGDVSKKIEYPLAEKGTRFANSTSDFRFAASVAAFGMILRDSPHRGGITMAGVGEIAASSLGEDTRGYRAEFLDLVRRAEKLGKR